MANKVPKGYPHLGGIKDPDIKMSLQLLWDQIRNHETLNTQMQDTVDQINHRIETFGSTADQALSLAKSNTYARSIVTRANAVTGGGGGGGGSTGGVDDGGAGAAGCSSAGSNGHIAAGTALTLETVGQICCGTGNEFPALLAPTIDQPTRDANAVELLRRMIWHLQLAGFTAGRQQNPSLAISNDKLTVLIGTVWWAYDVMSLTAYTDPMTTHMVPVGSPSTVADTGVAD